MTDQWKRVSALIVGSLLTIAGLLLAGPAMAADAAHGAPPIPTTGTPAVTVSKTIDRPDQDSSFLLTASAVTNLVSDPALVTKYQWYRVSLTSGASTAISGATAVSYRPTMADYSYELKVRAVVSKSGFQSLTVFSEPKDYSLRIDPATPLQPAYQELRVEDNMTPAVSQVLREEENGSVTSEEMTALAWEFTWYRTGTTTPRATAYVYEAAPTDVGQQISFKASLRLDGWLPILKKSSTKTDAVLRADFSSVDTPMITQSGMTLTVNADATNDAQPDATSVGYQWYRGGVAVTGKTTATYLLTSADFGKAVTVKVTYKRSGYTSALRTGASDNGDNDWWISTDPAKPVIVGTSSSKDVAVGAVLGLAERTYWNAHTGVQLDPMDSSKLTMSYQWYRDGSAISGATGTGETYTVLSADKGKAISVKVTAVDVNGLLVANVATSTATKPIGVAAITGAATATVSVEKSTPTSTTIRLDAVISAVPALDAAAVVKYQWYRDSTAVSGATASAYTLTTADRGKDVWVRATISKPTAGSTTYTSVVLDSTPLDYTVAPDPSNPPYLSGNNWRVGESLGSYGMNFVTKDGTASPTTIAYQWLRNGSPISGADDEYYFLVAADYGKAITLRLTVSSPGYVSLVHVVKNTYVPTIGKGVTDMSGGGPVAEIVPAGVGKLRAQLVENTLQPADPAPTYAYQWYRGTSAISGATASTYTLTSSDRGKLITVRITVKRTNFTVPSLVLAKPTAEEYAVESDGSTPTISGTARIGQTLTATPPAAYTEAQGGTTITPTLTYTWYRSGTAISNQSAETYVLTSSDLGKKITVKVTARATGLLSHVSPTSAATATVVTDAITLGTLEAVATTDTTLYPKLVIEYTGTAGTAGPFSYAYQWYRHADSTSGSSKVAISGATGSTYTLTGADTGRLVTVIVTLKKTGYTNTPLPEAPGNRVLHYEDTAILVNGVPMAGGAMSGDQLTAVPPIFYLADGSSTVPNGAITMQWFRDGVPILDANGYEYTVTGADVGAALTYQVTAAPALHASVTLTTVIPTS